MIRRKARLLYTALSISLVVTAGIVGLNTASGTPTPPPSLSANPNNPKAGTSLTVTWSGIPSPTVKDWIGLYLPNSADTAFLAFRYTESVLTGASEQFFVPLSTPPGTVEFRLFANDGFTRLAVTPVSPAITVNGPTTALFFNDQTVAVPRGGSKIVTWSGIGAPTPKDWIGLYSSSSADDRAFLAFRYTDSTQANGAEPFTIPPGTPPGSTYQFRLFSDDGFTRLRETSSPLTVT